MVATLNGNELQGLEELPVMSETSSDTKFGHWKDFAGSVRVRNIPLTSLSELEKGTTFVSSKGNETVLDADYAYFQVGTLLTQLGFSVKDIGSKRLNEFIQETLKYYPTVYNQERAAKEAEKLSADKGKIYAQAISTFKRLDAVSGRTDRANWSDDEWITWMSANGFIQQ